MTSARYWCGSSQARCAGSTPCARLRPPAFTQLIECGPGKVLTGLNRRIERRNGVTFLALEDPAALDAALAATEGAA